MHQPGEHSPDPDKGDELLGSDDLGAFNGWPIGARAGTSIDNKGVSSGWRGGIDYPFSASIRGGQSGKDGRVDGDSRFGGGGQLSPKSDGVAKFPSKVSADMGHPGCYFDPDCCFPESTEGLARTISFTLPVVNLYSTYVASASPHSFNFFLWSTREPEKTVEKSTSGELQVHKAAVDHPHEVKL